MEAVQVPIACPCPGTPHADGDTVGLRPKLGLRSGTIVQKYIIDAHNSSQQAQAADLTGALAEAYLLQGISEWTLVDELGQPLPVTPDNIRALLLDDFAAAAPIADKADDLYLSAVILPLVKAASTSSPPTPTAESTSASGEPTQIRRKRSKRSSTSTTPTEDTEATTASPDGGSSSSRSEKLAAG